MLCVILVLFTHEPSFCTVCGTGGCSRSYTNFSYKKHVYRKHRESLDVDRFSSAPQHTPDASEFEDDNSLTGKIVPAVEDEKRNSTLFILKARVMYKTPQVCLDNVINDFTSLVERKMDIVKMKMECITRHHDLPSDVQDSTLKKPLGLL